MSRQSSSFEERATKASPYFGKGVALILIKKDFYFQIHDQLPY